MRTKTPSNFCLSSRLRLLSLAAGLLALHSGTGAAEANRVQAVLQQALEGDRSGACVQAAVIEQAQILRGSFCAKPRPQGEPDFQRPFEIGSVSKTMVAFLVADLIARGQWTLDDPIAKHLPPGTEVPRQGERQILLRDLLTHSASLPALPPGFAPKSADDPYADLSESDLLAALAKTRLSAPIGSRSEYSNFGMMIVSAALARSTGGDLEVTLRQRLFEPLQMNGAFINKPPLGSLRVQGHLPGGKTTSAWHAQTNLSGVGMVKASLNDMLRYAQAQLGQASALKPGLDEAQGTALLAAMQLSQQPLKAPFGMNWMRYPINGQELVAHEGGTGGFSSLVALQPQAQRAVVLLADTSLGNLGGLGPLGHALLGPEKAVPQPRLASQAPAALLEALVGDYSLGGLATRLWLQDGRLRMQAQGQSAFELHYDSRGDFYPQDFNALLTPVLQDGRVTEALWRQGGGAAPMQRKTAEGAMAQAIKPAWRDYLGSYVLMPHFKLRVFQDTAGLLKVQATGQNAVAAELTGPDKMEIKIVAAVLEFKRDEAGQVRSLVLDQNGQRLEGQREP
ncbi:CubicO group peptidase (beta-lactamase class C family) [Paucibacter oligotrophus]|uniref:Beta-lactamase n=1 Tax=Roseateles oligotrophus TaxID=1769250 RepID=A0A840L923_9BURK|nr:serine hydrolase domain-containing protein [Roseateles oligotrophus]MBB4842698.1 CubicO group peptidase (beta-lactamase class C family) [Roseateles oligotrophus]